MSKKNVQMNKTDIIEVRMKRFFAMIIDWYLTNMFAVLPITFYLRDGDYLQPFMFDLSQYSFQTGFLLGLYGISIGLIYYLFIPSFIWKGQTLGKKICKIHVVSEKQEEITFKTMCIRELLGSILLEGGIVISATYIRKIMPLVGLSSFVTPLKYIAYALTILSILYAYFQPNSQSFHDKFAKTLVIKK